jgi:hypothetical protein
MILGSKTKFIDEAPLVKKGGQEIFKNKKSVCV